MKRLIQGLHGLIVIAAAMLLGACSHDEGFSVKGTLSDGSTVNLRVMYSDGTNLHTQLMASDKGHFEFEASAPEGTVVEVLANNFEPLGRFYAADGDEIEITIDMSSPSAIKVTGNDTGRRWADWTRANAGVLDKSDPRQANALIEKYVTSHPRDIVSTLLMIYNYDSSLDPVHAAALLQSIDAAARPAALTAAYKALIGKTEATTASLKVVPLSFMAHGDTLLTYHPRRHRLSLLVFSDETSGRGDSIVPAIRGLCRRHPGDSDLYVLDMSFDTDTLTWGRDTRADSATWQQGWLAGSVSATPVSRLAIPRVPYCIVVDSAGNQIYRGRSITAAADTIDRRLKKV